MCRSHIALSPGDENFRTTKIIRMVTNNTQDPLVGRSLRNLVYALHNQLELVHLGVIQDIGQQDVGIRSLVAFARE